MRLASSRWRTSCAPPCAWGCKFFFSDCPALTLPITVVMVLVLLSFSFFVCVSGVFSWQKFLDLGTVVFCFIWQLLFNHGLIRLKRFVSWFHGELCN
jgi:hypothetical protein